MDIKKTFLELTKKLVPYRKEYILLPYLPNGIEMDMVGNYRITIGKTRTMFTCHMDSYTDKLIDVVHKITIDSKGEKVATDGKTPLSADCKAGMTVMLNMIEHNIPGCYYFFLGEEAMDGSGCKGSREIFKNTPEFFTRFDRCIAFDRHGYDSIISSQRGDVCCSDEFVKELSKKLLNNRLNYRKDPTGRYTDSAVFMYTIPEVTNISTGGFNEHTNREFQNITYLEKLCNATVNISWEDLPTIRIPVKIEKPKRKHKAIYNNRKEFHSNKTYGGSGFLGDLENTINGTSLESKYAKKKRAEKEYEDYLKSNDYKNKRKRPRIKKYNNFNRKNNNNFENY
jgi:hypothetical protein